MSNPSEGHSDVERKLALVVQTGLLLTRSFDLKAIVQAATDAGLHLCGAQFGAFFYNITNTAGESLLLYTLSGIDREAFQQFPMPRNTEVFGHTFRGIGIVRSDDIAKDPRYGQNPPFHGMPEGHPPVRSYLAVPVKGQSGEVLGGLIYGHANAGVFAQSSEDLVATVAAQAAVAIENSRLRDQLTTKIRDLEAMQQRDTESAKRLNELAAIVQFSDDAIISKDLNGVVTSWNRAATRILGYSSDEMVGQSILKVIPSHLQSDEPIILSKIRSGERIEHFETVRQAKDGTLLDVALTVSPVRDATGTIVGASKILRDISASKRMESSLLQAEKIAATGRMAATIAHEINNPLEAVLNLLYLLRPMVSDVDGIGYLATAERELVRVSHIARQTLGFYREHATVGPASITQLAEQAIQIYSPRCSGVGIRLEPSLLATREVVLRKGEILQVISNLIANAIYAMPEGGTLRLSTQDTDTPLPGVVLSVEDTGVGISQAILPRIFDAFFTTRATFGTGIGLFVAKQFIEGHGGTIRVDTSTAPESQGTCMSIFLPLDSIYAGGSEQK